MGDGLCELFVDDCEFGRQVADADDLFGILETWEECMNGGGAVGGGAEGGSRSDAFRVTSANARRREIDEENDGGAGAAPVQKKQKGLATEGEGTAKISHITVERNRRKQMNELLAVLRSLMPCFYVKRGDQASIIGGVVDYIKELQQLLHSLEAKKHRKAYCTDQVAVLSPRPPVSSPRPLIKSPAPLSPRLSVPISPRTPTPGSPYKPASRLQPPAPPSSYMSPAMTPTHEHSPCQLPALDGVIAELAAYAAARPVSAAGNGGGLPDVKVEFAGANLVLKTVSHRARGQAFKIAAALEALALEILHVSISTIDDTVVHSFTIKIGIDCELSAEDLVQEIQQTFL